MPGAPLQPHYQAELTTVKPFSTAFPHCRSLVDCRWCWMPLPPWLLVLDHITPAMRDVLHWLPVSQWILFKMALTAFDSIHGTGLAYFKDVCIPVSDVSGRSNLRSVGPGNMLVPRTRTLLSRRSFRVAAPLIWNSLFGDLHCNK